MHPISFSLRRVGLIARMAVVEASRQRLLPVLLLGAGALIVGVRALQEFNFGLPELKFIFDFSDGVFVLFGSVLTIVVGAQLFFSEIENRTALTLLAKPVARSEFMLGKFLGVSAIAAVFCLVMTGLVAVLLWMRETALMHARPELFVHGRELSYASVAAVGFAHGLRFGVLAAFVLLIASFGRSSLFTMLVGFALLAAGDLQYLAQEIYAREGTLMLRGLGGAIALLVPDLQVFNLGDLVAAGRGIEIALLLRLTGYALCYVAAAGGLAVFSFKRREI